MTNPAEINEDQALTADELRDGHNTAILEDALSFQTENGSEVDTELNAQIEVVQGAWAAGDIARTDSAVDHLRGILEASYYQSEPMPLDLVPAARGVAVIPAGEPDEVFQLSFQMTRAQIQAVYRGLETMVEYPNDNGEQRAAEILLGSLPNEALNS